MSQLFCKTFSKGEKLKSKNIYSSLLMTSVLLLIIAILFITKSNISKAAQMDAMSKVDGAADIVDENLDNKMPISKELFRQVETSAGTVSPKTSINELYADKLKTEKLNIFNKGLNILLINKRFRPYIIDLYQLERYIENIDEYAQSKAEAAFSGKPMIDSNEYYNKVAVEYGGKLKLYSSPTYALGQSR